MVFVTGHIVLVLFTLLFKWHGSSLGVPPVPDGVLCGEDENRNGHASGGEGVTEQITRFMRCSIDLAGDAELSSRRKR